MRLAFAGPPTALNSLAAATPGRALTAVTDCCFDAPAERHRFTNK
jgi:hypothetical protein